MALFCLVVLEFRYFDFSRGVFSLFRLFTQLYFVISSFRAALLRLFAWRYFVFSLFRVALFRCEIMKRRNKPPYVSDIVYFYPVWN